MGLLVHWEDVPDGSPMRPGDLAGGSLVTKRVYGDESQLMVATRCAGYHSKPHVHDSEQLNWVAEGELWIFVEREGYHLVKGDFMRVPRSVLHWAWNLGEGDCVLVECHCPPTCARPDVREKSVPLFREGESPTFEGICETIQVPDMVEYAREVEESVLGKRV